MLVRAKLGTNILIDFVEMCIYIGEKPSTSQPQKQEWIILRGLVERDHSIYSDREIAFDVWGDLQWDGTRTRPITTKINRIRAHLGGPSSIVKRTGSGYQIDPTVPIELAIRPLVPAGNNGKTNVKHSGSGLNAANNKTERTSLDHNMPPILDKYITRPSETALLEEKLDKGHKQIFIWGEGGVGKTEFAISFANSASCKYECFFTTFEKNVEETVLGLNFEGWDAYEQSGETKTPKSREKQYSEKLALLRQLGKNCLLIIDNTDVSPDQLLTDSKWRDLERLDVKQLYTTRYEFDKANIPIFPFSTEQLYDYLIEHYIARFSFSKEDVLELIETVDRHTLTVDIIGRLLKAGNGQVTPHIITKALNQSESGDKTEIIVSSEYNRDYTKRSVFDHLQTVFNVAGLSGKELYVMQCASLVPLTGINVAFFLEAIGAEYTESLDALCEAGWLRRRNNQRFAMHPVIRTVIFYGKDTQPCWNKVELFATTLTEKCKYTDISFFFHENLRQFPAASVYMCLSNITQLPDIPDENVAEICETLAWELYFLNEKVSPGEPLGMNFLVRHGLLFSAICSRENILVTNRATPAGSIRTFTNDLYSLAATWFKIGCLFANFKDHDYEACHAFRKTAGMLLNSIKPNYYCIADCYGYAAYAYYHQGELYQAKRFLKKAKKAFHKAERFCTELYLPSRLPPTVFGFSYPEAKPKEIWGFFENNDEYWSYTYTLAQIQTAQRIPLLVNGSYKIYVDPSR